LSESDAICPVPKVFAGAACPAKVDPDPNVDRPVTTVSSNSCLAFI